VQEKYCPQVRRGYLNQISTMDLAVEANRVEEPQHLDKFVSHLKPSPNDPEDICFRQGRPLTIRVLLQAYLPTVLLNLRERSSSNLG
jgi:hypothetical protein